MFFGRMKTKFDEAYSIDVPEHILPADEDRFIGYIVRSITPTGACIIGTPSLESQTYASKASKEGHVNSKSAPQLKALMQRYFHNVFMFSMNDEVAHTGFHPLAHYLFVICANIKI
jgi:hypothetical protein